MRKANIVGQATDVFGDVWDVREKRATPHGWPLIFGWPHGMARGRGGTGGPRVVITLELETYLLAHVAPSKMVLPIGMTTIKRLCSMLGVSYRDTRAAWWDEREGDLMRMTLADFADCHGVSVGAASEQHTRRFGPRLRSAYWWAEPNVAALIKTMPTAMLAEQLGILASSARRLRQYVNGGLGNGQTQN